MPSADKAAHLIEHVVARAATSPENSGHCIVDADRGSVRRLGLEEILSDSVQFLLVGGRCRSSGDRIRLIVYWDALCGWLGGGCNTAALPLQPGLATRLTSSTLFRRQLAPTLRTARSPLT